MTARYSRLHDLPGLAPRQSFTTNPLGAVEQGDQTPGRRRRHLPDEANVTRLIVAVLLKQNDRWLLQHRYKQIEGMPELTPPLNDADPAKLPPHGGLIDGQLKLTPP